MVGPEVLGAIPDEMSEDSPWSAACSDFAGTSMTSGDPAGAGR